MFGRLTETGFFSRIVRSMDWLLFFSVMLISVAGLVTMNSFIGENYFFEKQIFSLSLSVFLFFVCSVIDWRFLRKTSVIMFIFISTCAILLVLFVLGNVVKGAQSWFDFGLFSFQPSDPAKLVVILVLAKYFTRRHIEIAHVRHILVSALYAGTIFALVFLQPDFGSAIIILSVWFGMVFVSGISKKHLITVIMLGVISFACLWIFVFKPYQKARIMTFIHPLTDIRGAGYNAYQSTIAVGSGQLLGKGVGYGTQSKLQFLPEYETDFIFAAFAEEWGFVGVGVLFVLFAFVIFKILYYAVHGASNFEMLFGIGLAILFISHFIIHVGMNIGLLPVTGTTIPFMSYGGSHLVTEFVGLGILMGMARYRRAVYRGVLENEVVGISHV
ncbi:MAG: rod shape-determining protein RodA, rod shape determining protein RodA [Candidatus Parcubacteria bacterium]|jgi:rod shape determining protein RodA